MKVTLAQIAPQLNRTNLELILELINKAKKESDLIVFPELSLNGYMLQDKLYEDAWSTDELQVLIDASKEIDIVVGAALRDGDVFHNAALYLSDGKILSQHNKVHLPNYGMFEEARYFEAGDIFESFISKFGKVSMLVCEDLWHDKVRKDLVEENPDFIIALVASPARGFSDNGLEIEDEWQSIISLVAQDCKAKVIFVNRVGFEDGLGFWGGSCILDEDAKCVKKLQYFKETIQTVEI